MAEILSATGLTTTDSYVEALRVDALGEALRVLAFRVEETGGANGIDFKVQGTLDGTNWLDLTLLDEAGAAHAAAEISVAADGSDQAFIAPEGGGLPAVNAGYAIYRVMIKATVGGSQGTVSVWAVVKD